MPLKLFEAYNSNLQAAIQGLDEEKAKLLKNNLSRFAAVKANQVTQHLKEAKKATTTQDEYKKQAVKVINAYNRFTAAEYNTFVHRCRIVKQWTQFQKEAHLYPNIEWLKTRSAIADAMHRGYWGRIWAMTDPFWNDNQPGCRYGCKCSVRTTDAAVPDNSNVDIVPASPGLEGNPYYTNEIVTAKHPYFKGVEKHIKDLGVLHNTDDIAYLTRQDEKGRGYQEHYLCQFEKEIKQNREYVAIMYNSGLKNIKMLPRINAKEVELRKRYYGEAFNKIQPKKCPDASADNQMIEFKEASDRNKYSAIKDAASKSNIAMIKLKDNYSDSQINMFGHRCITDYKLEKLIVINHANVRVFTK